VHTRPTTLVASLAIVGLLAAPLRADPPSKAKVASALADPNAQSAGLMGFFNALIALPDIDLTSAEVHDVLASSGLANGAAGPVLSSITHLSKKGSSVQIDTTGGESKIMVQGVEKGSLRLGNHVSATAAGSSLTDFSGVEVSTKSSPWANLKTLEFTRQGDQPVAIITAKWGWITKTIVFPIKTKPPAPAATPKPAPAPTPTPAPNPAPRDTTAVKPATPPPSAAPTPTPTPDPTPQGAPTDGFLPSLGKQ
jgi:hypothetical protein